MNGTLLAKKQQQLISFYAVLLCVTGKHTGRNNYFFIVNAKNPLTGKISTKNELLKQTNKTKNQ